VSATTYFSIKAIAREVMGRTTALLTGIVQY